MAFPAFWDNLTDGVQLSDTNAANITDSELAYLITNGVKHFRLFFVIDSGFTWPNTLDLNAFSGKWALAQRIINLGGRVLFSIGELTVGAASLINRFNVVRGWEKQLAAKIATLGTDKVWFELWNEAFMSDSNAYWGLMQTLVNDIRTVTSTLSLMVMSNGVEYVNGTAQWSFVVPLINKQPLNDPQNLTSYSLHDYAPMTFTHQGASWFAPAANLTNIHYYSDGRTGSAEGYSRAKMVSDLQPVHDWGALHNVHITMTEFGCLKDHIGANGTNPAPYPAERKAWISDRRSVNEQLGFGWSYFSYDGIFGIVSGSIGSRVLVDDMASALTWGAYQDGTPSQPPAITPTIYSYNTGHTGQSQVIAGPFNNVVDGNQDKIDISALFDAIGGAYSDPDTGLAARIAAVAQVAGDLDGDGTVDDIRITLPDDYPGWYIDVDNLKDVPAASVTPSVVARSTSLNNTASTTAYGSVPSGGTIGQDLLVAVVMVNGTPTITPPAGWALDYSVGQTLYSGGKMSVYTKTLQAGDAGATLNFGLSSAQGSIVTVLRITGADLNASRVYASNTTIFDGAITSETIPSANAPTDKCLVLRMIVEAEGGASVDFDNPGPSDATILFNRRSAIWPATSLVGGGIAFQNKDQGAVGTCNWNVVFRANGAVLTMIISPAAGGTPADLTIGSVTDANTIIIVDPIGSPPSPPVTASSSVYPKYKQALLDAAANVDVNDGVVKAVLIDADTYTYSDAHEFLSDVTGRVGTPVTLTGKSITNGVFDADDCNIPAPSGNSVEAVLLYIDTGDETTSRLVAYISFNGVSVSTNGGMVTIRWNNNQDKIFKI